MLDDLQKQSLRETAWIICDEYLDIEFPKIVFKRSSHMPTATTKALAVFEEDKTPTIYIDPKIDYDPSIVFVLAHELRHIYQFFEFSSDVFTENKASDELSTDDYNLQPLELDANAFGMIVMQDITGCKPLFYGLSESVRKAIDKQAKRILEDEFY